MDWIGWIGLCPSITSLENGRANGNQISQRIPFGVYAMVVCIIVYECVTDCKGRSRERVGESGSGLGSNRLVRVKGKDPKK